MTGHDGNPAPPDEAGRLSATLRLVGGGKLVLAGLTLLLAFTGYDTARAVNFSLLLVGVNLFLLGLLCQSAGRSFARAAGAEDPSALAAALRETNTLFGYYLILIGLAVAGVGIDATMFLAKILGR